MNKRDTLTKKQQEIYNFLYKYISDNGKSPTIYEIAKAFKVRSLRSVTQYLDSLQRKNLIQRSRYAKRGIQLTEDKKPFEEIIQVPVFASAGCGNPSIIAERTFDEFIPVSSKLTEGKKENLFVIKAIGNSLIDANIKDGDFVLVEMTENVKNGDLVAVIINETAVIKKIAFADNAIILNPVTKNPEYQPIILNKNFKIFGKVIRTIKIERNNDYQIVPIIEH
ncbi:MAG: transcriptional repressor LexA [Candidatus Pacebacteria bacterium]|nr:transcriptional repressor LexA [Candidatus Paceibacterota bacterium]